MDSDEAAEKERLIKVIRGQVRIICALKLWNKLDAQSPEEEKRLDEHEESLSLRQKLSLLDLEQLWNLYRAFDRAYCAQASACMRALMVSKN